MGDCDNGKTMRILNIYDRLTHGEIINKEDVAKEFNVSGKTITRDINDIDIYVDSIKSLGQVKYKRSERGYILNSNVKHCLKNEEILAITKILLESRAFCKEELERLIDVLLYNVSCEEQHKVSRLIGNEKIHFVELEHKKKLISMIWDLSNYINSKNIIKLDYVNVKGENREKTVSPVAITFSEFYFYLLAYNDENYNSPIVYRVDRIQKYTNTGEHFQIPEAKRFEDGEFRKRVQFMYTGKLEKIRFEFTGPSIEPVLDRLPTANILNEDNGKYTVEAEVFGKGVKIWILSQGAAIKVISPESFVEAIGEEIRKMSGFYEKVK